MVSVFDSSLKNLKHNAKHHNEPFYALTDENYHYYKKYSVEQSFIKFLKGTLIRFRRLLIATIKDYFPFTFKGSVTGILVDILIDKSVVVKAYYGKYTSAHLSFNSIEDFLHN